MTFDDPLKTENQIFFQIFLWGRTFSDQKFGNTLKKN